MLGAWWSPYAIRVATRPTRTAMVPMVACAEAIESQHVCKMGQASTYMLSS